MLTCDCFLFFEVVLYFDTVFRAAVTRTPVAVFQVFGALEKSHDNLKGQHNVSFEFWLNVEAFEYLRDDPCLPVDPASSGMGELLNRAAKARSAPPPSPPPLRLLYCPFSLSEHNVFSYFCLNSSGNPVWQSAVRTVGIDMAVFFASVPACSVKVFSGE